MSLLTLRAQPSLYALQDLTIIGTDDCKGFGGNLRLGSPFLLWFGRHSLRYDSG